MTQGSIQNDDI